MGYLAREVDDAAYGFAGTVPRRCASRRPRGQASLGSGRTAFGQSTRQHHVLKSSGANMKRATHDSMRAPYQLPQALASAASK